MSIELNIDFELDFDLKDDEVATAGGEKIVFDRLRLIRIPGYPTKTEGAELAIPGLFNWLFEEGTKTYLNQGVRKFAKLVHDPKAKSSLFFLVSEREQKAGNIYQKILHYYSGDREKWQKLQRPELLKLSEGDQAAITKKFVYSRHVEKDTSRSYVGNDGKTYYDQYYADFIMYPTREAWQAAKDEHFARTGGAEENGAGSMDLSNYPSGIWYSDNPVDLKKNQEQLMKAIKDDTAKTPGQFLKVAKGLNLVDGKEPVKVVNSDKPVDLRKLFAEALNCPEDDAELVKAFG